MLKAGEESEAAGRVGESFACEACRGSLPLVFYKVISSFPNSARLHGLRTVRKNKKVNRISIKVDSKNAKYKHRASNLRDVPHDTHPVATL